MGETTSERYMNKGFHKCFIQENLHFLVFTSSTKREIRQFHDGKEMHNKGGVMHVQSCCFANPNLLLFCRFHCRRCRRCLSSLVLPGGGRDVMLHVLTAACRE